MHQLSPSAKAILWAYDHAPFDQRAVAAVLVAAAKELGDCECSHRLLSIASEYQPGP
jgi:hypothetical protein